MSDEKKLFDAKPTDVGQLAFQNARRVARRRGGPGSPSSRRRVAGSARRGGWTSAGPDERDPQSLAALMKRVVSDRGWDSTVASASVLTRWPEIVGPEIASKCRPESLVDGELVLTAESTAWATQLRLLTPKLMTRLTAELGPKVVTGIRVHGPTAPSWRKGAFRVAGRGPRDTYG